MTFVKFGTEEEVSEVYRSKFSLAGPVDNGNCPPGSACVSF